MGTANQKKYEFERGIGRTNEAAGLIILSPNSAQNRTWFPHVSLISPTHKRTEGRAPVWGSEFTSKRRRTTGGIQQKSLYRVDSFQARAALTNRNSRVSKNEGAEL